MQRRPWGRLIAAPLSLPLLASCSSPSTPPPAVAPALPAASTSSSAAAPEVPEVDTTAGPPGLGPWAPLLPGAAEVVHAPRVLRAAATDKGVVVLARSRVGAHGCAWNGAPDETCTGFFFAPWKDGQGSPARFPVGQTGKFASFKVSRDWAWIWPGKQGAYALVEQDKKQTLGVLDGQREVTFQVEGGVRIEQIVETSRGPVALWNANGVHSAPLSLQGGKATLGKSTKHPVVVVTTAQEARELLKKKIAPVVEWAAIPNMTDGGGLDSAFLLTWSEAIPPEKGTDRVSSAERRILSRRNLMCGFSPSRGVDDPSVVKRIMVQRTTRDGAAEGAPREIARSEAGKEAPLLRLESRPKVRERLVGDSERVELPDGLRSPPEQEFVAAGYDPARKEGVVVLAQAGELVAQRIDPLGKPSGEPARLGAARPVERRPVFAHDGWVVPANRGKSILILTGSRTGTEIPTRVEEEALKSWTVTGATLVATREAVRVFVAVESDPGSLDSNGVVLHGELKKDSKVIALEPVGEGFGMPGDARVVLENGSVASFSSSVPEPGDPPHLRPMAWRTVHPAKLEEKLSSEDFEGESVILDLFRDHVLVHRNNQELPFEGMWLRSGKSVVFDGTEKRSLDDFVPRTGGTLVVPPSPGPLLTVAAPKVAPRGCVDELATGPRTRLWLCYKTLGTQGFSHTAGLQVMRF